MSKEILKMRLTWGKISEVIKALEAIKDQYGDLFVELPGEDPGPLEALKPPELASEIRVYKSHVDLT